MAGVQLRARSEASALLIEITRAVDALSDASVAAFSADYGETHVRLLEARGRAHSALTLVLRLSGSGGVGTSDRGGVGEDGQR